MSFVVATPGVMAVSATKLEDIGAALNDAGARAAATIIRVAAAGEDEVSTAIASVFSEYAVAYRGVSAQVAAFHAQFVQAAKFAAEAYAAADAEFRAWLVARQAGRVSAASSQPNLNDTTPAGGGG